MSPERFHDINGDGGPWADVMSIETRTDHMGSAWIVYLDEPAVRAPWREGARHVAAMFAASDVFGACQWLAQLRRIESLPGELHGDLAAL